MAIFNSYVTVYQRVSVIFDGVYKQSNITFGGSTLNKDGINGGKATQWDIYILYTHGMIHGKIWETAGLT